MILAIAMLLLAFADNIFLVLIAMFVTGLADGPQLAAVFAVRHREAPERFRSRVFTAGASLKITAAAIGAASAGQLATGSLTLTIIGACAAQVVAMLSFLIIRRKDGLVFN